MLQEKEKYNRLTVLEFDHKDKRHRSYYLCQCDCGNKKVIHGAALVSGNTKSCGCLSRETKASTALPGSTGAMRQVILQNYKRGGCGREWLLSEDEFYKISQKDCHYCGQPPSQVKQGYGQGHDFIYNGLDRIDSAKEYIISNVVPCCPRCNIAKGDMTVQVFYEWVKRINAMAEQWGYEARAVKILTEGE